MSSLSYFKNSKINEYINKVVLNIPIGRELFKHYDNLLERFFFIGIFLVGYNSNSFAVF